MPLPLAWTNNASMLLQMMENLYELSETDAPDDEVEISCEEIEDVLDRVEPEVYARQHEYAGDENYTVMLKRLRQMRQVIADVRSKRHLPQGKAGSMQ